MTTRETPELLPCPFCGPTPAKPEVWRDDYGFVRITHGPCGSSTGIRPKSDPDGEAKVIALWNTRADLWANPEHKKLAKDSQRPKLVQSDWVNCPICGESDMRKQIDPDSEDGQGYIYCVNMNCGSNGGDNFTALRAPVAVSDEMVERFMDEAYGKRWRTEWPKQSREAELVKARECLEAALSK